MSTEYRVFLKKPLYEILITKNSSHNFPAHIHNRICVGKINSGEKIININGEMHSLCKNDYFYITKNVPHSCCINKGKTACYTILCFNDIKDISPEMIIRENTFSDIEANDIYSLCTYAIENNEKPAFIYNNRIRKAIKYIDENYMEQLNVIFLAEKLNINSYYLFHLFRENTGLSIRQFIIQTRIKKIREYYIPEKNMLDTAINCGFYDQSHFIRHFKKHVGTTPKKYFDSVKIK